MSSGCSLCAATGQCSTAYKSSPGQFCGNWFDMSSSTNKPCCCPLNAACKVSTTQCLCHVLDHVRSNNYVPSSHHHEPSINNQNYRQYEEGGGSGLIIFILIVICCCLCCRKNSNHHENHHHHHSCDDEHTPVVNAYPVETEESCPAAPPSSNPAYHAYGAVHHEDKSGGAGTAIASGLGGFAAGAIIGEMIGRDRAHIPDTNNFGGGYDIAGDSGGGYDIVGDSGDADGGFDIQGDS